MALTRQTQKQRERVTIEFPPLPQIFGDNQKAMEDWYYSLRTTLINQLGDQASSIQDVRDNQAVDKKTV